MVWYVMLTFYWPLLYLVRVLVVLLHARFSVVGPIPFVLAAIFFPGHPYIGSTTVLPDYSCASAVQLIELEPEGEFVRISCIACARDVITYLLPNYACPLTM